MLNFLEASCVRVDTLGQGDRDKKIPGARLPV